MNINYWLVVLNIFYSLVLTKGCASFSMSHRWPWLWITTHSDPSKKTTFDHGYQPSPIITLNGSVHHSWESLFSYHQPWCLPTFWTTRIVVLSHHQLWLSILTSCHQPLSLWFLTNADQNHGYQPLLFVFVSQYRHKYVPIITIVSCQPLSTMAIKHQPRLLIIVDHGYQSSLIVIVVIFIQHC